MTLRFLTLAASALILSSGLATAQQQTTPETAPQQQRGQGMMGGQGMTGGQGMMGGQGMGGQGQGMGGQGMMGMCPMMGMMGQGMRGQGMMGRGKGHGKHRGPHMRIMFALIDSDGDGALSLQEVQAAHGRIFVQVDADKDGKVTVEEIRAFFRGGSRSAEGQDDDDEKDE